MSTDTQFSKAEQANRTRRAEPITQHIAKNGTVSYWFQADVGTKPDGSRDRRRFTYRTKADLEFGLDAAFTSSSTWIEREPDAADPTRIELLSNPLKAYTVVNARVGYKAVRDTVDVALVGSHLAGAHSQHPFGNRIERRVYATVTVTP